MYWIFPYLCIRNELFDSIAPQNAENRTVANSLLLFLKCSVKCLFLKWLCQTVENLKYEEALLHLINRSIEELASYKNIQWVGKDRFFRFKPIGVPRERKITWKNKKTATRTVVAEIWNNEKKQILYFRQLSFRIQSFRSDEKWFISITPGWSFTYDGYSSCKQESQLIAQKKNLETNSAVYQHFMFISFCLSNKLEDNESEYKYISFSSPFDLKLNYTPQHGY